MFYPLKFKPVYKDYIWGGRNLQKFGKNLPEGNVAESWEIACHPDGNSVISNGIFEGKALEEIVRNHGRKIIGDSLSEEFVERFPLLIKLIDANDKLSVQVHPGDAFAKINENGEFGKNEMWHILSAKPGAKLCYDVVPGTTREAFMTAVAENKVEKCLKYIDVFQGDTLNIPQGLVHAIGEGIVLLEVQQNSNTTYRVFDYNRVDKNGKHRPLHIEKALNVIDFNSNGRKDKVSGLTINSSSEAKVTYKIANEYFAVEIHEVSGQIVQNTLSERFYIYIVTNGSMKIEYINNSQIEFVEVSKGESVLIPAALGEFTLSGQFRALKTYVPDISKNIIEPLKTAGYSLEEITENVSGVKETQLLKL